MRHRMFGRKLGRSTNERKRLFRNLVCSLILQGRITTTFAKAKAIQPFVEHQVERAKENTLTNRRILLKELDNKEVVDKLLLEVGPLFKKRKGGYTRIIKLDNRLGDKSMEALISFTENVRKSEEKKQATKTGVSKPEESHAKNQNNKEK